MIEACQPFVRAAFERMAEVARLAGRHVNRRPLGDGTNSIAALVVHCAGVSEFWLGHVGLGRPTERDRDAEFEAVLWMPELATLSERAAAAAEQDLAALAAGDEPLVLHVIEELYQHLGHMEATLDALRQDGSLDEPLFHLALGHEWREACEVGVYERSTRGRSLAEEGFIHCSFEDQVDPTAERFFGGVEDVVLLRIAPDAVRELLRVEDLPGLGEVFPHLYGPLRCDAVLEARSLPVQGP